MSRKEELARLKRMVGPNCGVCGVEPSVTVHGKRAKNGRTLGPHAKRCPSCRLKVCRLCEPPSWDRQRCAACRPSGGGA